EARNQAGGLPPWGFATVLPKTASIRSACGYFVVWFCCRRTVFLRQRINRDNNLETSVVWVTCRNVYVDSLFALQSQTQYAGCFGHGIECRVARRTQIVHGTSPYNLKYAIR